MSINNWVEQPSGQTHPLTSSATPSSMTRRRTATTSGDWPPLRNSCDACNLAKVKCSKDRPSCKRCEMRKVPCAYSISLRSVKRSLHNPTHMQKSSPAQILTPSEQSPPPDAMGLTRKRLDKLDFHQLPTASATPEDVGSQACDLMSLFSDDFQLPSVSPFYPSSLESNDAMMACSLITGTNSAPSTAPSTAPSLPSSLASSCNCHQNVVRKLSELNTQKQPAATMAFDDFLTENKATMAVYTSVLECGDESHIQDLLLQVELSALLVHVISLYDQVMGWINGFQTPSFQPVRLSFGSYQLDQREERLLQVNLVQIELMKLGGLLSNFDQRFRTLPDVDARHADGQQYPLAALLAHLKQKVQSGFDAIQSWDVWL